MVSNVAAGGTGAQNQKLNDARQAVHADTNPSHIASTTPQQFYAVHIARSLRKNIVLEATRKNYSTSKDRWLLWAVMGLVVMVHRVMRILGR